MKRACRQVMVCTLLVLAGSPACAQPGTRSLRVRTVVTYVSASSVYLDAGREQGLAVGDTVLFDRLQQGGVRTVVAAVSARSAMAPLGTTMQVVVGDSATVLTAGIQSQIGSSDPPVIRPAAQAPLGPLPVNGRIALQYFGNRSADGFSTSMPALVAALNVPSLFGSGIAFSLHGRTMHELVTPITGTRSYPRTSVRIYEMAFRSDPGRNGPGFAIGRVTSRYAAGLGPIDGAEAYFRTGRITAGLVAGLQPDYVTSGIDPERQKLAAFINLAWQAGASATGDVTLAYGRLMFKGILDRDFVYVQSSTRLGSALFLHQSAEVDITGMEGNERISKPRITNTYINAAWLPLRWMSVDAGFDATRIVYYLESMNVRSDTVLDNTIRQGIRGGVLFRLPLQLQIGGRVYVRPGTGDLRTARTAVGTFRMRDILRTGTSLGVQVSDIRGVYADGVNLSGRLEFELGQWATATVGVERYLYTLVRTGQEQETISVSAMAQVMAGKRVSIVGGIDQVWEDRRPFQRIFAEIGLRF